MFPLQPPMTTILIPFCIQTPSKFREYFIDKCTSSVHFIVLTFTTLHFSKILPFASHISKKKIKIHIDSKTLNVAYFK